MSRYDLETSLSIQLPFSAAQRNWMCVCLCVSRPIEKNLVSHLSLLFYWFIRLCLSVEFVIIDVTMERTSGFYDAGRRSDIWLTSVRCLSACLCMCSVHLRVIIWLWPRNCTIKCSQRLVKRHAEVWNQKLVCVCGNTAQITIPPLQAR